MLSEILIEVLFVSLKPCNVEPDVFNVLLDGSLTRVEVLREEIDDLCSLLLRVEVTGGERHKPGEQRASLVPLLEHGVVGLDELPSEVTSCHNY